ncbi:MAG: disulfide bond formation protein B [Pseudomonadota bacterium]
MNLHQKFLHSPRAPFALIFFICAALLAFAYYAQYVMYLDPCPMCILQRFAFMIMAAGALLGMIHGSRGPSRWLYVLVVWLGGIWGLITAGRHVWIQNLPPDQVPDCGAGFAYNVELFGWGEAIRSAFAGSGDCALVSWRFLGLTMPGWTLVWYVILMLISLLALRKIGRYE